jgi:adenylate cyclase
MVDIDERSLERFGQWPWPRVLLARLLRRIAEAGPRAVAVDILLSEPDRLSPERLKRQFTELLGTPVRFPDLPRELMDSDAHLAGTLSGSPFVLGYVFRPHEGNPSDGAAGVPPLSPVTLQGPGARPPGEYLLQAGDVVTPLPELRSSASRLGFMNTGPDPDGILRRIPLLMRYRDGIHPSLALAAYLAARGVNGRDTILRSTAAGIDSLRLPRAKIPLDRRGRMLLHFKGASGTFRHVSAARILNRGADELLRDRIVLVGSTAAGLKDVRATPLDSVYSGLEVHATVLDNILRRDFLARPDWAAVAEPGAAIACGLGVALLLAWSGPWIALAATGAAAASLWSAGLWCMQEAHLYISPLYGFLALGASLSLLSLLRFRIAERERRFYRNAFSKYVSPRIMEQIVSHPEQLTLNGEEKEVTVLVCDIRDFTPLSERLSPSQVGSVLQDCFTPLARIITRNEGTLDKFIGDAVMAFWNAPLDIAEHRSKGVRAVLEMERELDRLGPYFRRTYGVSLDIGAGLHSGRCRAGNMGSADLFDYTVIGDSVNLVFRLADLGKAYGFRTVLTRELAFEAPQGVLPLELDLVRVKGRSEPVRVYGLLAREETSEAEMRDYARALGLYRQLRFREAAELFRDLCSSRGRSLYGLYRERCRLLAAHPPASDWDGVFEHPR